jgi:hypothetical protein
MLQPPRMKKALALSLIALVLIVVFGVLVLIEISHPTDWQQALAEYTTYCHDSLDQEIVVTSIERARQPDRFSADQSRTVFGDGVYYGYGSLPYPPDKVWCALVERKHISSHRTRVQVLFVALHQDLHNADWVVHEGETEPFSQPFLEGLGRMGCDLGLRPSGTYVPGQTRVSTTKRGRD